MRRSALLVLVLLIPFSVGFSQVLPDPIESRAKRLRPEDIPELVGKANAGDLDSQALLWQAYQHGWAVPQDLSKGAVFLRMAAEKGSMRAMFELADLYEYGDGGLPQDLVQGFQWMLRAAEKGHLTAQFNVAMYYRDGRGTKPDLQQSIYWLKKSAKAAALDAAGPPLRTATHPPP